VGFLKFDELIRQTEFLNPGERSDLLSGILNVMNESDLDGCLE